MELIIATANPGKLREIRDITAGLPLRITSLGDHFDPVPSIPEEGSTFVENAAYKARWVYERTGTPVLADDSGLEVDFLDGRPGVRSARYAAENAEDEENVRKLLGELEGVSRAGRTARFRCCMVLVFSADEQYTAGGACEGTIGFAGRGSNGFGYDPVFIPRGHTRTFAELSAAEKNRVSHRRKALNTIVSILHEKLENHNSQDRDAAAAEPRR